MGFGSVVWVEVWMVYRSTFRWRLGQFLGGFESEFGSVGVLVVVAFFFFWVILVVMDWCLWLSFGGRWLCGFIGEREREREIFLNII